VREFSQKHQVSVWVLEYYQKKLRLIREHKVYLIFRRPRRQLAFARKFLLRARYYIIYDIFVSEERARVSYGIFKQSCATRRRSLLPIQQPVTPGETGERHVMGKLIFQIKFEAMCATETEAERVRWYRTSGKAAEFNRFTSSNYKLKWAAYIGAKHSDASEPIPSQKYLPMQNVNMALTRDQIAQIYANLKEIWAASSPSIT